VCRPGLFSAMIDQAEAGGLRSAEGQPGIAMPCGRPGGLHSNTPFAMAAMFGEITGRFRRDTRTLWIHSRPQLHLLFSPEAEWLEARS